MAHGGNGVGLEFSTKAFPPEKVRAPCVIVTAFESGKLSPAAHALDRASGGLIRTMLRAGDLQGKAGSSRLLYNLPGIAAQRVLIVSAGKAGGRQAFQDTVRGAVSALADTGTLEAWGYFVEIPVPDVDSVWKARQFAIGAADAAYRFNRMKSTAPKPVPLKRIVLGVTSRAGLPAIERGLMQGRAIAAGMSLSRDLGNLPGNVCTPSYLAEQAVKLGRESRMSVEVLERRDMERLGMGALLSVARGSRQPPKLIVMKHQGAGRAKKPVVLVGKGITFDTGGISIKPAAEMDEMKFDMCGAASVLGCMRAAAEMKLPLNLVGIVPATENMPGGAATKPGDIVTSLSGQTIEILNTDAEGRLILCDALTFAERFEPQAVVDIATLTGACVIALGHVAGGLFANRERLAADLIAAGEESLDRVWRLPLWDEYQEQLKSNFADIANIGGRAAGSVTAACFLARFAKKYDWAHLDIAGIAWRSGKEKGATGRPVPLLTSFLLKRAGAR